MARPKVIDAAFLTKRLLGLPNPNVDWLMSTLSATGRENGILEYKASYRPSPGDEASLDACRWNIVRAIVSMANASGGCILLGIGEDGRHQPVPGNWDPDNILKRKKANEPANLADHALKVLLGGKGERVFEIARGKTIRVGAETMSAIRKLTKCIPCRSEKLDCGVLALIVSPFIRKATGEFDLLPVEVGDNLVSTVFVRDESSARTMQYSLASEGYHEYVANRRPQKEEYVKILLEATPPSPFPLWRMAVAVLLAATTGLSMFLWWDNLPRKPKEPPIPREHVKTIYPEPSKGLREVGFPVSAQSGTNEVPIALTWCPPGKFIQGSPLDEDGRSADEIQHMTVVSNGFWIGVSEINQAQWTAIMGTSVKTLSFQVANRIFWEEIKQTGRAQIIEQIDPFCHHGDEGPDIAMYNVTWHDAMRFCARLTHLEREAGRLPEGYVYRLPTEAEWEYACRAGDANPVYKVYPYEKCSAKIRFRGLYCEALKYVGWYAGNSYEYFSGKGIDVTRLFGVTNGTRQAYVRRTMKKIPNLWGIYDMLGNVAEWCADWYDAYPTNTVGNSSGPECRTQDASRDCKVLRGGSWDSYAMRCRAASRKAISPDYCGHSAGFRIVLALPRE